VHERRQTGTGTFDLPLGPRLTDEERGEVERRLRALIPRRADSLGIKTNVSVLESHGAAESILQAAKRLGVDVIVMASHGRSGLKRAVLGSVAEEVVRHASTPVLVVHEPAP
jgi:nucleotide-binding universal stress UspA family protein